MILLKKPCLLSDEKKIPIIHLENVVRLYAHKHIF